MHVSTGRFGPSTSSLEPVEPLEDRYISNAIDTVCCIMLYLWHWTSISFFGTPRRKSRHWCKPVQSSNPSMSPTAPLSSALLRSSLRVFAFSSPTSQAPHSGALVASFYASHPFRKILVIGDDQGLEGSIEISTTRGAPVQCVAVGRRTAPSGPRRSSRSSRLERLDRIVRPDGRGGLSEDGALGERLLRAGAEGDHQVPPSDRAMCREFVL